MDIKPWPVEKDYTFPSAWVDASGATVDDGSYLDEGLYERAMKEAWEARCRMLYAAVKGHNDACVTACGVGDQAGVSCGYRPYFPRRCPTCPLYDQIYDEEGRELLDVAIGELPPA